MRHFLVCETVNAAFSPSSGEPREKIHMVVKPHDSHNREKKHFLKLVSLQTARLGELYYISTLL